MQTATDEFSFILKPTEHGVGVFATHAIKRGTHLRLFGDKERNLAEDTRLLGRQEVPEVFRGYCLDRQDGKVICPPDFGAMSIGWYLNHSADPNATHRDFRWYASRDIQAEEEIMVDYNTLEEPIGARDTYYS